MVSTETHPACMSQTAVGNLDVNQDNHLKMNRHISSLHSRSLFQLYRLRRILSLSRRKLLSHLCLCSLQLFRLLELIISWLASVPLGSCHECRALLLVRLCYFLNLNISRLLQTFAWSMFVWDCLKLMNIPTFVQSLEHCRYYS